MEAGLYELVEKILEGVGFIAIGGALAIVFFFIFAPSILGLKGLNKQVEKLQDQAESISQHLKRIAERLGTAKCEDKHEDNSDNPEASAGKSDQ